MNYQTSDEVNQYHFLGRHIIALQGAYKVRGLDDKSFRVNTFLYSGFVMSLGGSWLLVTAGHNLRALEESRNMRQVELLGYSLVDYFGSDATYHQPIPFNYVDAPKHFVHDEDSGIDFGLVSLSEYYQRLLERNNVTPFTEQDWRSPSSLNFEFHLMLGLPEQLTETIISVEDRTNPQLKMNFQLAIVTAEKLSDPPKGLEKPYERFFARLHGITPLHSIKGMSGGPVLGFMKVNDRYKYWVVAIQSSWLPESEIIIGCPIRVFIDILTKQISSNC
jgi:hypothetical protein